MTTSPFFPTDLTPGEEVASFRLRYIADPTPYGEQRLIIAVIYRAGPSHRVVKRRFESGQAYYQMQHFSVLKGDPDEAPGSWNVVGPIETDPNRAVENAGRMMRNPPGVQFVSRLPPEPDEMQ
jgi:hypothetical protein